jgi:hypothetical protein
VFDKATSARHKNEARVIVTLAGQAPFEGFVFLKVDERLIDLLNDQRQFIPIKRADGKTIIAAKRNIVAIIEDFDGPRPEADAARETGPEAAANGAADATADGAPRDESWKSGNAGGEPRPGAKRWGDPYEILRVPRTATIEEIKRAYHVRMKAVHPDALAALELDADIERAANATAQRVNRAYRTLLRKLRKSDAAAGAS